MTRDHSTNFGTSIDPVYGGLLVHVRCATMETETATGLAWSDFAYATLIISRGSRRHNSAVSSLSLSPLYIFLRIVCWAGPGHLRTTASPVCLAFLFLSFNIALSLIQSAFSTESYIARPPDPKHCLGKSQRRKQASLCTDPNYLIL